MPKQYNAENLRICLGLARAIATKRAYQQLALAEIHTLLCHGYGGNPKKPRLRGFSNISVLPMANGKGIVQAPITLAPKCRLIQGKLSLQNMLVPQTILDGSKGLGARKIVDHPYLEGFTVRKAGCNYKESWFLLNRKFIELVDFIADINAYAVDV